MMYTGTTAGMTGVKRTVLAPRQPPLLDANVNPHPSPSIRCPFLIPFIYSNIYGHTFFAATPLHLLQQCSKHAAASSRSQTVTKSYLHAEASSLYQNLH